MIIIPDKTTPKFSYQKILTNPLTKEIFIDTLSQLGVQESTKKHIVDDFLKTINEFEDPIYTGDINHFKMNLYTTLDEAKGDIDLVSVLSTEEFISKSTKAIENLISISVTDKNINISLDEYIKIIRKNRKAPHILPVLRGLYRLEPNGQIYPDTSELVAALKKHLIINSTNDSISKLSSLVEKDKQNETIMRDDEFRYYNIECYIKNLPESSNGYLHMIDTINSTLEYFSNSNDYKEKKLKNLMYRFLTNLTKHGLSEHGRKYGYFGRDIYSIEYKQKLDIHNFTAFLDKNPEYKNLVINIMDEEILKLKSNIVHCKKSIENFSWLTREERCKRAPYRGAPIKSDQEYQRELDNLRLDLDMNEKNLNLIQSYILSIR